MPFFSNSTIPAILALEDGSIFLGKSIGIVGDTVGEVVFNTAMTGYQEILTDPSYKSQIVTLTYPHIGNTGINVEDVESDRVHVAGLIVKNIPYVTSNFRTTRNLVEYLQMNNIVAISSLDTRKLTHILREKGAQNGAIIAGKFNNIEIAKIRALKLARSFSGLVGIDLAKVVSTRELYHWTETSWKSGSGYGQQIMPKFHVVAFDYGIKFSMLRILADYGCRITVLPAKTPANIALSLNPDGIFLSNGPGDPRPCNYAIASVKELIKCEIPVFGICLGHQIIALASGAKTLKMKFGHHGINHPVQDLCTKKVIITSQNHGFTVDPTTLLDNCRITHVSLFDGSLQGFVRIDKPTLCFQGHPEASPGPHDNFSLFEQFIVMMEKKKYASA